MFFIIFCIFLVSNDIGHRVCLIQGVPDLVTPHFLDLAVFFLKPFLFNCKNVFLRHYYKTFTYLASVALSMFVVDMTGEGGNICPKLETLLLQPAS